MKRTPAEEAYADGVDMIVVEVDPATGEVFPLSYEETKVAYGEWMQPLPGWTRAQRRTFSAERRRLLKRGHSPGHAWRLAVDAVRK